MIAPYTNKIIYYQMPMHRVRRAVVFRSSATRSLNIARRYSNTSLVPRLSSPRLLLPRFSSVSPLSGTEELIIVTGAGTFAGAMST